MPRVRQPRPARALRVQRKNIGGGPNQNRAFDLANAAPYFKWAAHDDVHAPQFLERCVEVLDRDPGVLVAFTRAERIDAAGTRIGERRLEIPPRLARCAGPIPGHPALVRLPGDVRCHAARRDPPVTAWPLQRRRRRAAAADRAAGTLLRGARDAVLEPAPRRPGRHRSSTATRASSPAGGTPTTSAAGCCRSGSGSPSCGGVLAISPIPLKDRARCAVALARWTNWRRRHLLEDITFHLKDMLGPRGEPRT